jgi:hypothetical protein
VFSISDSTIVYTPATDYIGGDTLRSRILCNGEIDTATVYIKVLEKPDNIIEANCFGEPPSTPFLIKEEMALGANVRTAIPFVVGDLSAVPDGYSEIIAINPAYTGIIIFRGPDFTSATEIPVPGLSSASYYTFIAIGRIKINNTDYEPRIFVKTETQLLSINPAGAGSTVWTASLSGYGTVGLADFNNDGWTEIYVGNSIYDAATGTLLCNGGANNKGRTVGILSEVDMPQAADIIGDSRLELIAGNQIYNVTIDRSTMSGSMTVAKQVTPPTGCYNDGFTVVADFDNDGKLEVLVRSREGTTAGTHPIHLYLWTPHTATASILAATQETNMFFGIPFVGDIDGDKFPEIVSLSADGVVQEQPGFRARRYNPLTGVFDDLWNINHTDQSGATGMTLFDFNQDGRSEIVYRDESLLRIIDGSLATPVTVNSFPAYSGTAFEYPVVADIFSDGHARILVTSDENTVRPFSNSAKLKIFSADGVSVWAPARNVWNQYSYNAVNVNEDLTIPKIPLNPATVFPGEDGIIGTGDDLRPYNNFLQQQTALNANGTLLWLLPDFVLTGTSNTHYYTVGDSLVISNLCVKNEGDARGGDSIRIAVYRNGRAPANLINVYKLPAAINVGTTRCYSIKLAGISSISAASLYIEINDDGLHHPQTACDSTSNNGGNIAFSSIPIARNDRISVFACGAKTVDVLANDLNVVGGTPSIIKPAGLGTAVPAGSNISYTAGLAPVCGGLGGRRDTVVYRICSGGNCSDASLFIDILRRPSIQLADSCSRHPYLTLNYRYPSTTYQWYRSTDGSPGSWTPIAGANGVNLYVTEEAYYKVEITYAGDTVETAPVRFVVNRKARLQGGLWWYDSSLTY